MWAGAVAKHSLRPLLVAARQGQRRDAVKNKASAATLSQQEENDSADVKRDGVNISGFLGAKLSYPSRRYPFGEFELFVRALLRALHH